KLEKIFKQSLIEFAKVINPNIDLTTSENQKLISGTSTTIVSEVRRAIEFGGSGGIHIPGEAETTRDLDKVTSWPNRCGVCGKEIQSTVCLFENNVRYCKDCYDKRSKEIE
ncbi:MAG: hypothetical protein KAU17_15020, partial [Spirochaetales bacterium]|nr:hypothetical protein [Spirochaetales bacterium]